MFDTRATGSPVARQHRPTGALAVLLVLAVLTGCAAAGVTAEASGEPGFWLGLWHGLICPVTFWISLVNRDVGIYQVPNGGHWYDAGFMLGVSTVFAAVGRSGASAGRLMRRPRTGSTRKLVA